MQAIERIYSDLVCRLCTSHEVGVIIPKLEKYSKDTNIDPNELYVKIRKFIRKKEEQTELDLLILESINIMKVSKMIDRAHKK